MISFLVPTWQWIKSDYESNRLRFAAEIFAWMLSIGAAILFATTVPDVPFLVYLSMTIVGSGIYAWAAWTRQSFGMLANYLLLTTIDTIGLTRLLA